MSDDTSLFDKGFALVIGAEGGYTNDPRDPGGETKFGISKRAYPNLNIATLTIDQAKGIYFEDYWVKTGCDQIPYPLNIAVFDCSVNQGKGTAICALQNVLGLTVDGVLGPKTVAAAQSAKATTLVDYLTYRAILYSALPAFKTYGKGWLKRLFNLMSNLLAG